MPSNPLLLQLLFPQQPPKKPLSPPHNNSNNKIMKMELKPLSQLFSLLHDADDKSFIAKPPE